MHRFRCTTSHVIQSPWDNHTFAGLGVLLLYGGGCEARTMAARKRSGKSGISRPSAAKNPAGLNERQQRFVDAMLIEESATKAALSAGYSPKTARVQAQALLTNPAVSRAIADARRARSARVQCDADWVLEGLRAVYQRCMSEVKPIYDMRGEFTGEFQFDSKGATKSLELLGKHLGMYVDRKEVSGPKGGPIRIDDLMLRSEEELEAEIRDLAGEGSTD